jgi:hypothetical protein
VPNSASRDTNLSIYIGENRRSDSVGQGRLRARKTAPRNTKVGGNLRSGTVTRNYRIMALILCPIYTWSDPY